MLLLKHALLTVLFVSSAVCSSALRSAEPAVPARRSVCPSLHGLAYRESLRLRGGAFGESVGDASRLLFADRRISVRGCLASLSEKHMRGVVFGGMDGILTTFALLAAVAGSNTVTTTLTLVIGVSTVLADALSMAAGEYLAAKAEDEMAGGAGTSEAGPLEKGAAMFIAFTVFGSMPLLGFSLAALIASRSGGSAGTQEYFFISVIITAATLFALGTIKSSFGAGVWWQAGLEVTAIGGAAALVAYYSAQAVSSLMGA